MSTFSEIFRNFNTKHYKTNFHNLIYDYIRIIANIINITLENIDIRLSVQSQLSNISMFIKKYKQKLR